VKAIENRQGLRGREGDWERGKFQNEQKKI
jgi:hypothetical protein